MNLESKHRKRRHEKELFTDSKHNRQQVTKAVYLNAYF